MGSLCPMSSPGLWLTDITSEIVAGSSAAGSSSLAAWCCDVVVPVPSLHCNKSIMLHSSKDKGGGKQQAAVFLSK